MKHLKALSVFTLIAVSALSSGAQPVYLDLKSLFNSDTVLESGGTGLTDPLDPDRNRIDGNTLPAQPAIETDKVYLLAATLNSAGTPVEDWMLQ